jgi:adenosylmethionine-8-amino-7-oxononanoate aminotransferase
MNDGKGKVPESKNRIFGGFSLSPLERVLDHGDGIYLYDKEGNRYIDFCSSPLACGLGHCNKEIRQAVMDQMEKYTFCWHLCFSNEREKELAAKILAKEPKNLAAVQLVNSGSEAVDTAIKLAHQYYLERGKAEKQIVISRWQSYHGMTLGALSLTGFTYGREKFGTLLYQWPKMDAPLCYRCPYDLNYPTCRVLCAKSLDTLIRQVGARNVSAVIAEPIGGATSGATVPVPEYYGIIREICDKHDVLFIDDEVICGFGRTGKWFGLDHWSVKPDIIIMAKGISSVYVPLAAVLIDEKIVDTFKEQRVPFIYHFTTASNPISCAVGCAVVDIIEKQKLVECAARLGDYLHQKAREMLLPHPTVGDIRGKGLLMGVELVKNKKTRDLLISVVRPIPFL